MTPSSSTKQLSFYLATLFVSDDFICLCLIVHLLTLRASMSLWYSPSQCLGSVEKIEFSVTWLPNCLSSQSASKSLELSSSTFETEYFNHFSYYWIYPISHVYPTEHAGIILIISYTHMIVHFRQNATIQYKNVLWPPTIKHRDSSFSPEPEVGPPPLLLRPPRPPGEAAGQQWQQRPASPTSASCQGLSSTPTGTEMAENDMITTGPNLLILCICAIICVGWCRWCRGS